MHKWLKSVVHSLRNDTNGVKDFHGRRH